MCRDSAVRVRQSHPMLALVVATGPRSYGAGKMRGGGFRQSRATAIVETRRLAVKCGTRVGAATHKERRRGGDRGRDGIIDGTA